MDEWIFEGPDDIHGLPGERIAIAADDAVGQSDAEKDGASLRAGFQALPAPGIPVASRKRSREDSAAGAHLDPLAAGAAATALWSPTNLHRKGTGAPMPFKSPNRALGMSPGTRSLLPPNDARLLVSPEREGSLLSLMTGGPHATPRSHHRVPGAAGAGRPPPARLRRGARPRRARAAAWRRRGPLEPANVHGGGWQGGRPRAADRRAAGRRVARVARRERAEQRRDVVDGSGRGRRRDAARGRRQHGRVRPTAAHLLQGPAVQHARGVEPVPDGAGRHGAGAAARGARGADTGRCVGAAVGAGAPSRDCAGGAARDAEVHGVLGGRVPRRRAPAGADGPLTCSCAHAMPPALHVPPHALVPQPPGSDRD
ncbi:unnamed protein product [Pedinophyceae sp. YPF-701]|nr:unnamed protein product [Pedinophyceae sp. YPF-701]